MTQAFGPYLLLESLATGGMGEVFRARVRDSSGERTCVVKRLSRS